MARFLDKHTRNKTLLSTLVNLDQESGLIQVKDLQFPPNTDPKPPPLLQIFFAAFNVVESPRMEGMYAKGCIGIFFLGLKVSDLQGLDFFSYS